MITGAQAMVKSLECEGVTTIFGYPGATICAFFDSVLESPIRNVLTRTEQNAGHAASGYARITGKPGICVTTSGPGATNLLTAIATAYADSIPLICITGQVPSELLGRDVFQEVDTTGAADPFTKYSYLVKNATDIPRVFKEAFHIASTGRKGPVLIDMPQDVQTQTLDFVYPKDVNIRGYKPTFRGHPVQVKRVAAAIREAKRPLLCLGGGVFSAVAQKQVRQLCERYQLPAVTSLMGIGALPTAHPQNYGMLGHSGVPLVNEAIQKSDLLVLIGTRAADRALSAPHLQGSYSIIHIDIDAAEIGKNLGTTIPLVGDAAQVLGQLMEQDLQGDWSEWTRWLNNRRSEAHPPKSDRQLNPHEFIRLLSERMEDNAIYVADVGQNQIWSARNCVVREGRFLTTGGMGTMSYSLPAAIGAKMAAPDRQVVAVCGDGSFQMNMMELATANQQGVPVKLVVMRNGYLGLVREIQGRSYGGRESGVSLEGSPDICGIAAAYGIPSRRISNISEAASAIQDLLTAPGSFILECVVDAREVSV